MKEQLGVICVVLSLCFVTRTAFGSLTDGLVLHYTFDKDERGIVTDASGKGWTAQVNGATWVANGACGGAYRFDNNSKNIKATDAGLPSGDAPRSLTMWMKIDKEYPNGCTGMLGYGTDGFGGQFTGIGFDWRNDRDRVYFTPGGSCFLSKQRLPASGTWMHVAYTYGGSGVHHLYFNGVESDGMSEMGRRVNTKLSGQLIMGGHPNGEGPDGGYLDDVRIYNRVLSPEEVAELSVLKGKSQSVCLPLWVKALVLFLAGVCSGGVVGFFIGRLPQRAAGSDRL